MPTQEFGDTEQLRQEIDTLRQEQEKLTADVMATIKRLKVPWSRIPNAPVDDCVMLSRRLIKVYQQIKDMPEKQALDFIQNQINARTINLVVGNKPSAQNKSDQEPGQ